MAPRSVPVTFGFGLQDRVDPKLAPFGVLKVGKNLRVRKDGRLGSRHGYELLPESSANGDLYANDLHEYRGRLIALGSDKGDGYPTDLFEFIENTSTWRGCDPTATRVVLNPFANLREVAGLPQPGDGIEEFDAAIGDGLLCMVYNVVSNPFDGYALIVDVATDQVVHMQRLSSLSFDGARVVYSAGTFYIAGLNGPTNVVVYAYTPGVSTSFASFLVDSSIAGVTAFDMCAVSNASTARIALAIDRQAGFDLVVKVYDDAAAQVGSSCTVAAAIASRVSVEADEADDTINLYSVESGSGSLRTFNFSGTLLNGPTATTAGSVGALCRLPTQGAFAEHVAVAVTTTATTVVTQFFDVDTHAVADTVTVQQARLISKPFSGQSANQPMAVVFAAVVGPDLTALSGLTNALFFVTPDCAHMATRDLRTARRESGTELGTLSRDEDTGQLCWLGRRDAGGVPFPAVTVLDFQSDARRESVPFGGLLYFAGATPSVYDGRFPVPLNFGELPGIASLTPSSSSGDLAASATYTYVLHWEYVLADGSVMIGPVSDPLQVSTGASDQRVTASVSTPHTVAIALGDALYGANVSAVLSRTVWDATGGIEGSVFRRCAVEAAPAGMASYGAPVSILDQLSDEELSDEAPIYTQAERGPISAPLQHFAPLGCSHVTATEARIVTAGLAREFEVQISKAAFLGEAFEFSPLSPYFTTVAGPVRGVRHLDGAKLVFTADRVYAIGGDGPDDIGAGALDYPREIPTPGGLSNAWSFLEGPDGLWFQIDDTKLFRIPRGGGAPSWEGVDVQDTLAAYPEIVGTAKCKADNAAVFACNGPDGESLPEGARLLVRDFRTEQWFVDEVPTQSATRIDAITSWQDALAYAAAGRVWQYNPDANADTDDDLGTAVHIETQVRTHPLYPFGLGGYGQIHDCLITGEALGVCVLECRVSYDDGATFTNLDSFELTGSGTTIQRKWALPQDVTSSVVFEFTVTQFENQTSRGFVFNQIDLLVETEPGLRELKPGEMA